MASPFSISETTVNSIANTVIYAVSNVTDYAASSVMDYLNDSTECLRDNNEINTSVESFKNVNVINHMAPKGPTNSTAEIGNYALFWGAILGILAVGVCCRYICTEAGCDGMITQPTDDNENGVKLKQPKNESIDHSIDQNIQENVASRGVSSCQISIINESDAGTANYYQPTVVKSKETTL